MPVHTAPALTSGTLYGRFSHRSSLARIRANIITNAGAVALFLPLYAAVLWAYRGDRKAGVR